MTNKSLLTISFIVICSISFAQDNYKIDSLENVLKKNLPDTMRLNLYQQLFKQNTYINPDKAVDYVNKQRALAKKTNNKTEFARSTFNLGVINAIKGNYENALSYLHQAVKDYSGINKLRNDLVNVYVNLGGCYMYINNLDSALICYNEALKVTTQQNNNEGIASVLYHLAIFYYYQNQPQIALNYARRAEILIKTKNRYFDIAELFRLITILYSDFGKPDSAFYYSRKALKIYIKNNDNQGISAILNSIGNNFKNMGKYDSSIFYYKESLKICINSNDEEGIALASHSLSTVYLELGRYEEAIANNKKSMEIYRKLDKKEYIVSCYIQQGDIYQNQGLYVLALTSYFESLKLNEEIKDTFNIGLVYGNIANIHISQNNLKEAMTYIDKSIDILSKIDNKINLAATIEIKGDIYTKLKQYKNAHDYYIKSLNIRQEINDSSGIAYSLNCIANLYLIQGEADSAITIFYQAIKVSMIQDVKPLIASSYQGLAKCFLTKKNYNLVIEYGEKAYKIAKSIGNIETQSQSSEVLSETYSIIGNFQKAFEYQKFFKQSADSLSNKESTKRITAMVMQYNFDNQQKQEKIEQIIKENAQNERLQRQKMFTLVFSIAFVLILLLAFVIFRNYRRNKKVLQIISLQKSEIEFKNNILQQQSEEILTQNEQLALSKKNITDSIQYASQIQNAMLPGIEIIENLFFDYFVLFNPCHIVSGDFYWFKQIKNYVYIVAADCTGHGVPGAFMSMLGISLLNEIVTKRDVNKPHEILNELRNRIKESLHQTGNKNQTQDGIDIAFCMFDTETQMLQFAGAYNPFYLIRNNELIEYKADRMPIGIHPKDKLDFVSTEIQLQQQDKFYIFSDGYVSQFGGSKDEKFKTKRFQELLLKTNNEPMQNQKQFLVNELDDWRGNIPQTDDILVIGIHVNGQKSS